MHENEILVFLLSSCVLLFIASYRDQLKILPAYKILIAAFLSAWVAWISTVAEHLVLPQFFNVLEHIGYCLNGVLLLVWCWFGMRKGREQSHD